MRKLDTTKFFGVTHAEDGSLTAKVPRVVKVSMGLPKGKDIHVRMAPDNTWIVQVGEKRHTAATKDAAITLYNEQLAKAGERKFPKKISYYTFTQTGPSGDQEPAFDLIERFGCMPTDVNIVFLTNATSQIFESCMKMYSKSKLLCYGNGIDALRVNELARTAAERSLVIVGEKYFPITGGCSERGCPYSLETVKNGKATPPECKPSGTFRFQVAAAPMLGGDYYLATTGKRTISNITALLEQLCHMTKGVFAGIVLRMMLRPYNTPKGTSYSVTLTMTAESERALIAMLSGGQAFKQLDSAPEIVAPLMTESEQAATFTAEFTTDDEDEDYGGEEPPPDDHEDEGDDEPTGAPEPTTVKTVTLESLDQKDRDEILILGRTLGMNKAKIDAALGSTKRTVPEFIEEMKRRVAAKEAK